MSAQPATAPKENQFASLYVGDLSPEVTEAVLYEVFNAVGPVASIRVCRDSVTRRSLGYAYVNFHQAADADRAIEALNYSDIKGHPCRIMWCHRDPAARRNPAANIYIKNLDKSIDNRTLYDTFSVFGNILSCKLSTDAEGKSRGFAFVHFESEEAATAAIEKCNGMQLGDKTIFVGPFAKQTERPATEKPFTNVYVKHLPEEWDDERVRAEFAAFGDVTSVLVKTDSKGRRFAFVNFKDFDEAKAAVQELHGKDLRSDEQKAAELTEEERATLEEEKDEGVYTYQLYVVRAQSKEERAQELKTKFTPTATPAVPTPAVSAAPQNANLYIKNLSETVDDEELQRMFEPFGAITSAKIMRDEKGVSRCFGFVCFASADEATRAVTEMHLKLVNGKPLYVGLHERKEQRLERLQQRYRMAPMIPAAGMMMGGMMGQRPLPGQFGAPQQGGMYSAQQQPGNGFFGRPAGVAPQMPPQRMAPQLGGFPRPAMPGQMPSYMMGTANPMMRMAGMPPQGIQQGMAQPKMLLIPGAAAGMRPVAGVPPQMAGRPQQPMPQRPGQFPVNPFDPSQPLTAAALAAAPPAMQKQMLGEKLFPLIGKYQPELAGKITGMMLEMDNSELLILLESEQQLRGKVEEAMRVLHGQ